MAFIGDEYPHFHAITPNEDREKSKASPTVTVQITPILARMVPRFPNRVQWMTQSKSAELSQEITAATTTEIRRNRKSTTESYEKYVFQP